MPITKVVLYILASVEIILMLMILDGQAVIIDSAKYTSADGRQYLWTIEEKNTRQLGQKTGRWIRLYEINNTYKTFLYENDFLKVYPWEIDVGDIDGNGQMDIYIGTFTETRYYPWGKRPFFFSWQKDTLIKKWTGSYINEHHMESIRLIDYNHDKIHEVEFTGKTQAGEGLRQWYRWANFSFYPIKK